MIAVSVILIVLSFLSGARGGLLWMFLLIFGSPIWLALLKR